MIVDVLLATYNGARFLPEQIESVLAQADVDARIIAHDDGSSDESLDILQTFSERFPDRIRVLNDGVRCGGAKANFLHLLRASQADYAAFCDQDDVWLPAKLSNSMQAMAQLEQTYSSAVPLLVYTDLRVVDNSLATISDSLWASNGLGHAQSPSFAELLTENVVTGCTALLNRALIRAMATMPAEAQMHDHWAALIASGLGAMKAIPSATVLYRQHDANVVGAIDEHPSLAAKVLRFVSSTGAAARERQATLDRAQAERFLQLHGGGLSGEKRDALKAFLHMPTASRWERLRSASRHGLWKRDTQRRVAQWIDYLR